MRFGKLNRDVHRWATVLVAVPLMIVLVSGVMLQLKKEVSWIQPPTRRGSSDTPSLGFAEILAVTRQVPEAEVASWDDIDRLDVRPGKGVVKVRCKNRWEIQLDAATGAVLQVAYRRSDLIESMHDGSFFHDRCRLWVFFPSALLLGFLWLTGIYLFLVPYLTYWKKSSQLR